MNRLTDVYNAVSVLHQIPLGGEDLTRYSGPPRLVRAIGEEPFDTVADGSTVIEHPDTGEVVWCDDAAVTCRRRNRRQARRTQLADDTSAALFILDALTRWPTRPWPRPPTTWPPHLTSLGPTYGSPAAGQPPAQRPMKECINEHNPELTLMWAVNAYTGLSEWARNDLNLTFKVVKKPPDQVGFKVLPRRWIVELSLSWLMRARRNARDYELPRRRGNSYYPDVPIIPTLA